MDAPFPVVDRTKRWLARETMVTGATSKPTPICRRSRNSSGKRSRRGRFVSAPILTAVFASCRFDRLKSRNRGVSGGSLLISRIADRKGDQRGRQKLWSASSLGEGSTRGVSASCRAPALHAGSDRFESCIAHSQVLERQGLTVKFSTKELGWIEYHCTDIPPKSPVSYCCTTLSTCTKTTACRIAISSLRVICDLPFSFLQTVL